MAMASRSIAAITVIERLSLFLDLVIVVALTLTIITFSCRPADLCVPRYVPARRGTTVRSVATHYSVRDRELYVDGNDEKRSDVRFFQNAARSANRVGAKNTGCELCSVTRDNCFASVTVQTRTCYRKTASRSKIVWIPLRATQR